MSDARADDGGVNPCGTFDFSGGLNCKIEVSGGCKVDCAWLKEELACAGTCNVSANTMCTNNCGTTCIQQCNPQLLDCFKGCHGECDAPTADACRQMNGDDCGNRAIAQCDIHCKDSCKVPPSNCQEHCTRCCTGSCTTQINIGCDMSCFTNANKDCGVQCDAVAGAIFCNGQYVHASDVQACVNYLLTQGIKVDVSARGNVMCDATGCHGGGSGCEAAPFGVGGPGFGRFAWCGVLAAMALTALVRRGIRRRLR